MARTETAGVGTEGEAQVGRDTDDEGNDHEVTTELITEVVSDVSGSIAGAEVVAAEVSPRSC